MDEPNKFSLSTDRAGKTRILIGLAQGIALYLLYEASEAQAWPATHIELFVALVICTVLSPLVLTSGLTQLLPGRLIAWTAIVTIVCALTAMYDMGRDVPQAVARRTPSFQVGIVLLLSLFIAHSLVIASGGSRRLIAPYPSYFSASWKIALQTAMAIVFAVAMWLVLWFGAQLFTLIRIDAFSRLLQRSWFNIPVTALALNCAIHVTDVRDGMVRGLRTLACNLLAWLLPLMTVIATAFVVALPFTGVELLWSTRHAAQILLGGAAGLIILINAAYQDGGAFDDTSRTPRFFEWSVKLASAVLLVLVPLAAYGLAMRINQYGWTPDRVFAVACAIVAAAYAIGYGFATARGPALRPIQITNVITSCLIVAILLVLISAVGDPARISVADQMRRLKSGKADPTTFDYRFLRFEAGRFGFAALEELKQSPSPVLAQKATEALARKDRFDRQIVTLSPDALATNITTVSPVGAPLPRAFLETDWTRMELRGLVAPCLHSNAKCEALLIDLGADKQNIVLVPSASGQASLYRANAEGIWGYAGTLVGSACKGVREALLAGRFEIMPSTTQAIAVNGRVLPVTPRVDCALMTSPKP